MTLYLVLWASERTRRNTVFSKRRTGESTIGNISGGELEVILLPRLTPITSDITVDLGEYTFICTDLQPLGQNNG